MSLYIEGSTFPYIRDRTKKNANIFRMDREIGAIKDTANEHSERSWENWEENQNKWHLECLENRILNVWQPEF